MTNTEKKKRKEEEKMLKKKEAMRTGRIATTIRTHVTNRTDLGTTRKPRAKPITDLLISSICLSCWSPRVRRRPLSEISLWSTGSPMSWRVSQTPECSGLLTATRGFCVIDPQRQPGKFKTREELLHNRSLLDVTEEAGGQTLERTV